MFEKYKKVYKADYEKWYKENEAYRERVAADQDRLKFHLMPKTGWLNDPNGLCQFNGTYHIYYQYTPFEPTGELKTWGHYTTKDFIHYEDFGPVVFPDEDIDAHGVYSGSAFIEDDTIHYFYTGNLKYFSTTSAKISNPPVEPPAFKTRPIPSPNKNPPNIQINN